MTNKNSYSAKDIKVLKGLEPVRKRPGMYTRTENPNHIIQEVVDNAQDEALGGHATAITVEQHEDGSISVEDDGRGIPTDIHPDEGVPVIEVIFTSLHSGAKFDKSDDNAYGFSGGLHGVGVSVTNALSTRMDVTVWRDGYQHTLTFENGNITVPLKRTKLPVEDKEKHGTRVHAWPDPKYFEHPTLNVPEIERYLRTKGVLLKGTRVTWIRPNRPPTVWEFPGGLPQYLEEQADNDGWVAPVFNVTLAHDGTQPGFARGEGFELAMGFAAEGRSARESYVNLIPTPQGGRHESGLRQGMLDAVRAVADRMGVIPKGIKIEGEDVWARMSFILSVKLMEPDFQGQTKDRLTSEKAQRLVAGLLRDVMELWLNDHPVYAQAIVELVVNEAVSRSKTAAKAERKRGSSAATLPGKLSDCDSKDVERTELFIVEGDSAGGSGKQGRDKSTQAILPIRGKLLNSWETESHKALESETVHDIAVAIGVDPHPGKKAADVDLSRLRYGKVFIMADADVDGSHIQVLLLTLFLRHFPALIEKGIIWIARAPLYRIDAPAKKGTKVPRKFYATNQEELASVRKLLGKEGLNEDKIAVSRFKGLGEMNPEQLWETTMNPDSRSPIQIKMTDQNIATAAFNLMMVKKNANQRREWMEAEGHTVEADV
jgi:topoisomerase-4 subunit B